MKERLFPGLLIGLAPAFYLISVGVGQYFDSSADLKTMNLYIGVVVCTFAGGAIIASGMVKRKSLINLFGATLGLMLVLGLLNVALACAGCTCQALSHLK